MHQTDAPQVLAGGHALTAFSAFAADPVGAARRFHDRLGSNLVLEIPFSKRTGGRRFLITADKQLAETVLNAPDQFQTVGVALTRGPKDSAQRRLRDGIVRMNGPQQRALRHAYAPPLAKPELSKQAPMLARICAEEVAAWPRNKLFIADDLTDRLTRRAAAELLFGAGNDDRALDIAEMIGRHSRLQWDLKTFLAQLDIPGSQYRTLLRHARSTETALIKWLQEQPADSNSLVGRIAAISDIDEHSIDTRARAAQLWTLFGASFETTATALRWALCHLAWNSSVQAALKAHLQEEGAASPFLDWVILECLRMSPPVAFQLRRLKSASSIAGVSLHRSDTVVINAAAINRAPQTYSRPNEFRPERWQTQRSTPLEPLAFSAGPRRCLGFQFAMNVLRTSLAELCKASTIEILDTQKIGVRLAITQGPKKLVVLLSDHESHARDCRFRGSAARQMSEAAC